MSIPNPPTSGRRRFRLQRAPSVAWAVALLAAFLAVQHLAALHAPFFSDDYLFLDKLRNVSLAAAWSPHDLAYHWYRPWSRELHYWTLFHLFGLRVMPYHLACFGLWLASAGLYYALVRRVGGAGIAALAASGVAALAACDVLIEWAPGAQDLWMLLFTLLFLHAFARRRTVWAAAALILALLSKETAAVLPGLAFAWTWAIDRTGWRAALRRSWGYVAIVMAWAALHPSLGGALWWARARESLPAFYAAPWRAALLSLLSLVNLDMMPRPLGGWIAALRHALPGAVVLAALAAWGLYGARRSVAASAAGAGSVVEPEAEAAAETGAAAPDVAPDAAPPAAAHAARDLPLSRLMTFGWGWALLAWLPLLMRSVIWQPYYAWFGALGAWIALAALLSRRRALAVALVATIALMRGVRADTPSRDWGNEWTQRFGKTFMAHTESYLCRRFPTPPRHARLFFGRVPRGVVFITGPNDAPALRVWFGDSAFTGGFWSDYRPRDAGEPGDDYFFRYDTLGGWVEVARGPENVDSARAADPDWRKDHENLAFTLARAGDYAGAAAEYAKLADVFPRSVDHAALAAICFEGAGDTAEAAHWYRRAAALPGADSELKERARKFQAAVARTR